MAAIIKYGDMDYRVLSVAEDGTETIGETCKIVDDGKTIALTPNESNRKYFNIVRFEKTAIDGKLELTYKETIKLGTGGTKTPNSKLIEYLSDEDKAEYEAIIARAREAMEAARKKPVTKEDKIMAKIAKLQAELEEINKNKTTEADAEAEQPAKKSKKAE